MYTSSIQTKFLQQLNPYLYWFLGIDKMCFTRGLWPKFNNRRVAAHNST